MEPDLIPQPVIPQPVVPRAREVAEDPEEEEFDPKRKDGEIIPENISSDENDETIVIDDD